MKAFIIAVFLLIPFIGNSQDSTRVSKVYLLIPRELADSLVYEVRRGRACAILVQVQAEQIQAQLKTEEALTGDIAIKREQIALLEAEIKTWDSRLANQFEYTKELKKQNKKLKTGIGIIGVVAIVAIIL